MPKGLYCCGFECIIRTSALLNDNMYAQHVGVDRLKNKSSLTRGIRFPLELYRELTKRAQEEKEPINRLVVRLLRQQLKSPSNHANASF